MSELWVYPIDAKLNMTSFYLYLKGSKNTLFSKSLNEMEILNSGWLKYVSEWKAETGSSSKLNFCGEIKEKYTSEKILDFIDNRQHKAALTKLRISAHRLHIETGRYKRHDYNLRSYVIPPREERTCSVDVNEIEDKHHFFECEKNKALRKEFYRKITPIKENFVTMNNPEKVQFLFSLSETERGIACEFSKFVCQSFKVTENHT